MKTCLRVVLHIITTWTLVSPPQLDTDATVVLHVLDVVIGHDTIARPHHHSLASMATVQRPQQPNRAASPTTVERGHRRRRESGGRLEECYSRSGT